MERTMRLQVPVTVVLSAAETPANPRFSGVYTSKSTSPKTRRTEAYVFGTFGTSNQKLIHELCLQNSEQMCAHVNAPTEAT